jgi:hypothetical protein
MNTDKAQRQEWAGDARTSTARPSHLSIRVYPRLSVDNPFLH